MQVRPETFNYERPTERPGKPFSQPLPKENEQSPRLQRNVGSSFGELAGNKFINCSTLGLSFLGSEMKKNWLFSSSSFFLRACVLALGDARFSLNELSASAASPLVASYKVLLSSFSES